MYNILMNEKEDYLYEVMYEHEDDPYCAHWDESEMQTHNKDLAVNLLFNNIRKNIGIDREDCLESKKINSFFNGYLNVLKYDNCKDKYVFDHVEYISKWQVSDIALDLSEFKDEFVKFFRFNDTNYYERAFKFNVDLHFIDGHHIETEFEYIIKKKRFTGNTPFDYFIYVEGSPESKIHESYNNVCEGIYNIKKWSSGITYPNHMNDDIEIQSFALTVINDDTFKRKFFSSFNRY